ncbi:hypothetical protein [Lacisediminihabitans changchengi]|uniref:Uncharacterized protein n=1 Tax=Lacisediminihabitans changchengi TaxID=2787634 RepID=A0A934SJX2_9MICO|nr:hypothetical protein [Lacisediminihabitans changchengi]MBK4346675.1 hypothetical protein [Lacisediminihabitans changchengi]
MKNNATGPCPAEYLLVSRISVDEWRIADGRLSDGSAAKVLGFIQYRNAQYEVLNIKIPDHDEVFSDWESAVGFFAAPVVREKAQIKR